MVGLDTRDDLRYRLTPPVGLNLLAMSFSSHSESSDSVSYEEPMSCDLSVTQILNV